MNFSKTLTIFLLLFTIAATMRAQESVQIDYFKALSLNAEELKIYMSKLGLTDYSATKDENGFDFSWTIKQREIDSDEKVSKIHIFFQKDRTKLLSFHTDLRDDYLKFKKAVDFNGLKLYKQKNYNDFMIEIFASKIYESTIYAKPDDHIMHYEISLKKVK